MNSTILADLRNVLAELYSDESSIRRIVDDAGLERQKIDFGSSAINVWHFVLTEAEKINRVEALLRVVESEYDDNREFQSAYQAYRQSQGKQENVDLHANVSTYQPKTYPKTWQQRLHSVLMGIALLGLTGGGAYWALGGLQRDGNSTPPATTAVSTSTPSAEKSAEDSSTSTELPTATQAAVSPSPTNIAIVAITSAATPTVTIPQPTSTPREVDSVLCSFAFLVLDEQNEEPIRRATIAVFVGIRQDTGTTDSTGYYLAHLPCSNEQDVEAQVRISAENYSPYSRSLFLSNKTTEILLEHQATPTPNVTSTATFTPVLTPQPTATATPVPAPTYPCTARVITTSGARTVDSVYQAPTVNSPRRDPLVVGMEVTVTRLSKIQGSWYNIFKENVEIGWVSPEYLDLSACPKNP